MFFDADIKEKATPTNMHGFLEKYRAASSEDEKRTLILGLEFKRYDVWGHIENLLQAEKEKRVGEYFDSIFEETLIYQLQKQNGMYIKDYYDISGNHAHFHVSGDIDNSEMELFKSLDLSSVELIGIISS